MTPKEALKVIDKVHDYPCPYGIGGTAWLFIRECIEKRIPKKPVITTHHYRQEGTEELGVYRLSHCPYCWENKSTGYFESLIDKGTAFCSRCGQKLDWRGYTKGEKQ